MAPYGTTKIAWSATARDPARLWDKAPLGCSHTGLGKISTGTTFGQKLPLPTHTLVAGRGYRLSKVYSQPLGLISS